MGRKTIKHIVRYGIKKIINPFNRYLLKKEFQEQVLMNITERSLEYKFVLDFITQEGMLIEDILDVGSGNTCFPALLRGFGYVVYSIDNVKDYWKKSFSNKHYYILDDSIIMPKIEKKFDLITCISVLEHIETWKLAILNISSLLKSGGHLILTFPYNQETYIYNAFDLDGCLVDKNPNFITQIFSDEEISVMFELSGLKVKDLETWKCWDGEYWRVGKRLPISKKGNPDLICLRLQK